MTRPDAHLRATVVERTNRLSIQLVRFLTFAAVAGHLVFVALLLMWVWQHIGPGATFVLGVAATAMWTVWLRAVEFYRAFPGAEDVALDANRSGPARLRRGGE